MERKKKVFYRNRAEGRCFESRKTAKKIIAKCQTRSRIHFSQLSAVHISSFNPVDKFRVKLKEKKRKEKGIEGKHCKSLY